MKTKEEIIKSHLSCICDEIYTSRKKVDPSCTLCEYGSEIELMMEEYAEQKQEWISVKERLPEGQGHYLVYCPQSFPKNYRGVVAEFYEDNKTFYSESSDYAIDDATHWMTLPKEPEK